MTALATFAASTLAFVACSSATARATRSSNEPAPTETPTATTVRSAVDTAAHAAVLAPAHAVCIRAAESVKPLIAGPAPLPDRMVSLRSDVHQIGRALAALPFPAADRAVRASLAVNIRQADTDLDRARAQLAAGQTEGASASFADATDHLGQDSSILEHYGVRCDLAAQPSRAHTITASAAIAVGTYPSQVTATATDVWVSRQDGRAVVRVDAQANRVVAVIAVDDDDLRTIQVTNDGVWVRGATAMHRIDPATNRVVRTIVKTTIGAAVTRAVVDDAAIWACNGNSVVRAAKSDGHPLATMTLPYRCGTLSAARGQVWVASDTGEPGHLSRIDEATNRVAFTAAVAADAATFPAIGTTTVWTHSQDVGAAHRAAVGVDAATGRTFATTQLTSGGGQGALAPTVYYAADTELGLVDAIDAHSGRILRTYDGGAEPNAVALTGTTMWVVDEATDQLLRFDLANPEG